MSKLLAGADAPAKTEDEKEAAKDADDVAAAVEGLAVSGGEKEAEAKAEEATA